MLNSFILPCVFSILPIMIFKIELLQRVEPWLAWLGAALMIYTQPCANLIAPWAKSMTSDHDKWSGIVVMFASYIVSFVSIFLFITNTPSQSMTHIIFGFFSIAIGLMLRWFAIRTLGVFFTAKLQINPKHNLIKTGIFKYVRHPSYLGVLIIICAQMILYRQLFLFTMSVILLLFAYLFRIKHEEKMLIEKFGDEYRIYQKNTKCIIPFIY